MAITTAASSPAAVKIYDDAANAGIGELTISNVGWWVTVPANAPAGTYSSTFAFSINSGALIVRGTGLVRGAAARRRPQWQP